jgi:hypothetical protein
MLAIKIVMILGFGIADFAFYRNYGHKSGVSEEMIYLCIFPLIYLLFFISLLNAIDNPIPAAGAQPS